MANREVIDQSLSPAMTHADVANGEGRSRPERLHVLIAVDSSASSIETARAALRLIGPDARYVLVNVGAEPVTWATDQDMWGLVPPAMVALSPDNEVARIRVADDERSSQIAGAEATAAAVASASGLDDAEAVGILDRNRADAVVQVARDYDSHVIVLGQSHRGWIDRMFRGTVTGDVLKRAECPVLVVP